jgi:hypothetical protein
MANPVDYPVRAPEAGTDILSIQFAVGATGAVGAIQGGGLRMKEFRRISVANPAPVVRTGAGIYDVFLREPWLALLGSNAEIFGAVVAAAGWRGKITTNSVTVTAAPKVTVTYLRQDTGVAADPSNGDIASIMLFLKKFKPL